MAFETLSQILDGLITAVFVVDRRRKIIFANNVALQQFDAHLVGVDFVQAIRDPECLSAIDKVLDGRKNVQVVTTLLTPVRTTYRISVSRVGGKGNIDNDVGAQAVICLEDISHIYEAKLMRSDFVANVSHELRSPLTALNGFIETLKGPAKNDKKAQKKFLDIMENEANRMNRLIGDLLSLSKVEANQHVRPKDSIDIVAVIRQVLEILKPLASRENTIVELNSSVESDTNVVADEDQIIQIFLNLLENAIKYGGANGNVVITVFNVAQTPGVRGPVIGIEFTDQGAGIAKEHLPRLTERFYRVDKGRSRDIGGTGLGLAIVKHIIARHRGRLNITSEVGKGSSFIVYLPI